MEKLLLVNIIKDKLHEALQESYRFQAQIKEAKTRIKKNFYLRKLKKNNKEIMRLLVACEKLNPKNANEQPNIE